MHYVLERTQPYFIDPKPNIESKGYSSVTSDTEAIVANKFITNQFALNLNHENQN